MQKALGICVTGSVVTRFPPENSGHLHVGHVKAMVADFDLARESNGRCILRFDDTNPDTETQDFADAIVDDAAWLGFHPDAITYTSDYFDQLYSFALKLIDQRDAYVCHLNGEDVTRKRRLGEDSPWRDRPTQQTVDDFDRMSRGQLPSASLRLKTPDHEDPIAYRCKSHAHYKTGDRWSIYPSYEMSHCIVDSLEGITHSLCSKEFEEKRERYYWLLERLGLTKPAVHEFSRLKLPCGQTSKRAIKDLIASGEVDGWNDPRLLTVGGLRRRGFPAEAVTAFCREAGITNSDSTLTYHNLMYHVRSRLNADCPRLLAVMNPLEVIISNLPDHFSTSYQARKFPQSGTDTSCYDVELTKRIWIQAQDFQSDPAKSFYGLAPGRRVLLKYAVVVECVSYTEIDAKVTSVEVRLIHDFSGKLPKGVLGWVAQDTCLNIKIANLPDYDDICQSIHYVDCKSSPYIQTYVQSAQVFQIERQGYYVYDSASGTFLRTCQMRGLPLGKQQR